MGSGFRCAARAAMVMSLTAMLAMTAAPAVTVAQETPMAVATADPIQLREQPGWDGAALLDLLPGHPVQISGDLQIAGDGTEWTPVVVDGVYGFLPSWAVGAAWADGSGSGEIEAAQPAAAPAPEPAPEAAPVDAVASDPAIAADDPAAAEPAPAESTAADAPAADAAAAPAPAPAATLYASDDVNLRAVPQPDGEVLAVLPVGSPVSVTGEPAGGFLPVNGGGIDGWIAAEYLADVAPAPDAEQPPVEAAPAPDAADAAPPAPAGEERARGGKVAREEASKPGSVIALPFRGGTWEVIQGYNGGTHTNRSDFAKYKYAIDWARVDGPTAGADIYAPVGGSIGWTDPGSGGVMIDTGAGWGIVLFHIVPDRGIRAGANVEQGQRIGRISAPGEPGFMNVEHVETDVWRLNPDGTHDSIPFTGEFTIGGHDFPDVGGNNQHMGFEVGA